MEPKGPVFILPTFCSLGGVNIITHCFLRTVSLLFILSWCWDCFFARDSMLSSFCHIYAKVGPWHVASAYLMLTYIIFSTYLVGILLLILIFSYMNFRYSTINAPYFVIFACWMPMEGQIVAIVVWIVPVTNLAVNWAVV